MGDPFVTPLPSKERCLTFSYRYRICAGIAGIVSGGNGYYVGTA